MKALNNDDPFPPVPDIRRPISNELRAYIKMEGYESISGEDIFYKDGTIHDIEYIRDVFEWQQAEDKKLGIR